MGADRQAVKYTFWKIDPQVLTWPAARREEAAAELAELLDGLGRDGTLLTYSTVGLRGDCDLLVWQAADRVDDIQHASSRWRDTRLGPYLQVAHSFLAMLKPSPYLGGHRHPDQERGHHPPLLLEGLRHDHLEHREHREHDEDDDVLLLGAGVRFGHVAVSSAIRSGSTIRNSWWPSSATSPPSSATW